MSLFNRDKKQPKQPESERTVEEILSAAKFDDFGYFDDLLPHEAIACLGLDPNGDPNVLVPELIRRSRLNPQYGIFNNEQSLGEYLIYQSPMKNIGIRLLQNPKEAADENFDCLFNHTVYNLVGRKVDDRAWSRGWMTQDQYWGELLSDCYSEMFPVYQDLDGPDFPTEWLTAMQVLSRDRAPDYAAKLADRSDMVAQKIIAAKNNFMENTAGVQPSPIAPGSTKESENFGPDL